MTAALILLAGITILFMLMRDHTISSKEVGAVYIIRADRRTSGCLLISVFLLGVLFTLMLFGIMLGS